MFAKLRSRQERQAIRAAGQLLTDTMEFDDRRRFAAHFARTKGIPQLEEHLGQIKENEELFRREEPGIGRSAVPYAAAAAGYAAVITGAVQASDFNMISAVAALAGVSAAASGLKRLLNEKPQRASEARDHAMEKAAGGIDELKRFLDAFERQPEVQGRSDIEETNRAILRSTGNATINPKKSSMGMAHEPYHNLTFSDVRNALGAERAESLYRDVQTRINGMPPEDGAKFQKGLDYLVGVRRLNQAGDRDDISRDSVVDDLIHKRREAEMKVTPKASGPAL